MKRILQLLLYSSIYLSTYSQFNKSTYNSYRITADSIMKLYYGEPNMTFITIDSNACYYGSLKGPGGGYYSKFTTPLEFEPEKFKFQYYLTTPLFWGDSLEISFFIDKSHRLMEGMVPEGLLDMREIGDLKIITRIEALQIAKKAKINKPIKNYEIELGWLEQKLDDELFKKTKDIRDLVKGYIVWRVKSKFRVARNMDEKPHTEIFLIDAFSGAVIGKEQEFIDWASYPIQINPPQYYATAKP